MFIVFVNIVNSLFKAICIVMLTVGLYQKNTNALCKSKKRLDGKTVIITGGTNGSGLEISKDLADRGAKVIIAGHSEEEGNEAKEVIIRSTGNENVRFEYLDLSSFGCIRKFASEINKTEDRLDILVNNASVGSSEDKLTQDGLNYVMQVNYFGTVLLTLLLMPLLKKSGELNSPSRIINTTSMINFIGTTFSGWKQNGHPWSHNASSKLCIALFTRELARRIQNYDVVVNVVDPGITNSPKLKRNWPLLGFVVDICFKNAWEGAQTAIFAALCDNRQNGKYFCNCEIASIVRTPFSYDDDEKCQLLWKKTMDIVKVDSDV